jgi:serine/threonine protein kinase
MMAQVLAGLQSALEGRYVLERELGRGGMATVYLAHDLKHDRRSRLRSCTANSRPSWDPSASSARSASRLACSIPLGLVR